MSPLALALVLCAACLHATWNLLAKQSRGGAALVWSYSAVSLLAVLPAAALAWRGSGQPPGTAVWFAAACSGVAHLAYGLVLQRAYRSGDFSLVYPVARGTGPLFAVLAAVALLHERPSPAGWAGIAAILAGIVLLSSTARRATRAAPGSAPRAVLWGAATGLCIAAYTVIDGWAVSTLAVAPVLYYGLGVALRALLLAPLAWRDPAGLRGPWRRDGRRIVAIGILSPLAYLLVLYAMTLAPLAYVAPARELSMLVGLVLSVRLLHEGFSASRALATASMLGGVVLLALAR